MSRLGWTQQEIAEVIGKSRSRTAEIVGNINTDIIDNFYQDGKTPDQIASMTNLDVQTGWNILLEDKEDADKLEILDDYYDDYNLKPQPYDVWGMSLSLFRNRRQRTSRWQ